MSFYPSCPSQAPHWPCRLLLAVCLLPGMAGCGHLWEDVTSRSNEPGVWANMSYRWDLVFNRPEPLEVLASSHDGDMRRRALVTLDTKGSWWKKEDPEVLMRVLTTSAAQERDPINRALAIERLVELDDPRVPRMLIDFYGAEINADARGLPVRIAAVRGMGQVKDSVTIETLTGIVHNRELPTDLRLAAADSLGNHENHDAAGALVKVLRDDRDVAIKYRAHQSLQKMSGRKDIPARADAWEEAFREAAATGQPMRQEPNPMLKLVTWWRD
ncbi:MAG TPA: HEAT repeat domain-containing protein [Gemmatales bacterium]|nr:HEAT repeat domain-containing protein [Gemmatales bacterium]HMP60532.1 HEAT repeat domain-containing protein [Gemmatales bacterium]